MNSRTTPPPFKSGYYEASNFLLNGDTISRGSDTYLHWNDFVIDNGARGSVGVLDSSFRIRYGRSYFYNYSLDSLTDELSIKRFGSDSIPIFKGKYTSLNDNDLRLEGLYKNNDSLQVDLIWEERNYPLAKKEFNWLLENVP